MSIQDTLTADMKTAMKAKDKIALGTIRTLKSAIKNSAIEKGGADAILDDAEVMAVIRKQIKQRQDSLAQYTEHGRPELAEVEQGEINVLQNYLPTPLTPDEVNILVLEAIDETNATTKADMGKVMALAQKKADGKTDGKTISQAVMKALS